MHVYVDYIDRPLQGIAIALTRSPSLPPVRSFWFTHTLAQWVHYAATSASNSLRRCCKPTAHCN